MDTPLFRMMPPGGSWKLVWTLGIWQKIAMTAGKAQRFLKRPCVKQDSSYHSICFRTVIS